MTATATRAERVPAAVLTEQDILQTAAEALQEHERLRLALRASDDRLRTLCRQYGHAAGVWGFAPHHLAQACKARGLL
jgi:hypothetical protein